MNNNMSRQSDVTIIGAGPAGAAMAAWLAARGIQSVILEAQQFPRFSIGESLLPEALNCLEQAGLLEVVEAAGFQHKDGALFATNSEQFSLDFGDGITPGRGNALQVPRADFDQILADACIARGVEINYQTRVQQVDKIGDGYRLRLSCQGQETELKTRFLVDASGFGRVLARQFKLEKDPGIAPRTAMFSHFAVTLEESRMDLNKILIAQTEVEATEWYWLIPFSGDRCSVGMVTDLWQPADNQQLFDRYQDRIERQHLVSALTASGSMTREVGCLSAYSASIDRLYGDRYVILGNAGEFIDPIFSSGVTIALKSAMLAAPLVKELIHGNSEASSIDWQGRFQDPLMEGVNTFKEYVNAWYAGTLPKLFYAPNKNEDIYRMICSILAGYVWDRSNAFTRMTAARLKSVVSLI